MEQWTGSKLGKEYLKAVYPDYLTYMQSTSCEMLGWMKHKLESRLQGEISITSDMRMTHPYGRKWRGTKEPLDESEREWKSWLKTQHSKNKDHCIQPHSVQLLSHVQLCNPINHSMPCLPVHHQFPEFTQTHVHWVGDAIQLYYPLSSPSLPALNLSQHQGLSNESALWIRWPKYWSFSLNISPSNEHSGLISFRMDWLDFLAVQGTLKGLIQHHSSKASILWHSTFFIVQISHPYMTTGKTIALTRWTFVDKVISAF